MTILGILLSISVRGSNKEENSFSAIENLIYLIITVFFIYIIKLLLFNKNQINNRYINKPNQNNFKNQTNQKANQPNQNLIPIEYQTNKQPQENKNIIQNQLNQQQINQNNHIQKQMNQTNHIMIIQNITQIYRLLLGYKYIAIIRSIYLNKTIDQKNILKDNYKHLIEVIKKNYLKIPEIFSKNNKTDTDIINLIQRINEDIMKNGNILEDENLKKNFINLGDILVKIGISFDNLMWNILDFLKNSSQFSQNYPEINEILLFNNKEKELKQIQEKIEQEIQDNQKKFEEIAKDIAQKIKDIEDSKMLENIKNEIKNFKFEKEFSNLYAILILYSDKFLVNDSSSDEGYEINRLLKIYSQQFQDKIYLYQCIDNIKDLSRTNNPKIKINNNYKYLDILNQVFEELFKNDRNYQIYKDKIQKIYDVFKDYTKIQYIPSYPHKEKNIQQQLKQNQQIFSDLAANNNLEKEK